jgi:hypothetical protein
MTTTMYYYRFWKARFDLEELGVKQPLNEMIKFRLVSPDKRNENFSLGRARSDAFLSALETLHGCYDVANRYINDFDDVELALAKYRSEIKEQLFSDKAVTFAVESIINSNI